MKNYPRKIVISGQTHGNEWTGTYVIHHLKSLNLNEDYPKLDILLLLANPKSFENNRRYVDQDLNRSFGQDTESHILKTYELWRAKEIQNEIDAFANGEQVFILDLHTTTANMGSSIVMHDVSPENISLFSYMKHINDKTKAYAWIEPKALNFLNSLSTYGFAIEVGPIAHNTLTSQIYDQTLEAVHSVLTFLNGPETASSHIKKEETVYCFKENIDYPRNEFGDLLAMIAPEFQNLNFETIEKGQAIFETFEQKKIAIDELVGFAPVFINEAAYYEKGIAFTLTKKEKFPSKLLPSG